MKELWKISFYGLKTARIKSIFLYLSMILSVCLLTSLFILKDTFQVYYQQVSLRTNGDYILTTDVRTMSKLKEEVSEGGIQDYEIIYEIGLSQQDEEYIAIKAINRNSNVHTVTILDGGKPTNENEVMISEQYAQLHDVAIGDTITIAVGTRVFEGEEISIEQSYVQGEEFQYTRTLSDMKITGIYNPVIVDGESIYTDEMIIFQTEASDTGMVYLQLADSEQANWETLKSNYAEYIHINTYGEILFLGEHQENTFVQAIALLTFVISIMVLLLMYHQFSSSIEDQKSRIGMLQSIGMSDTQLLTMYIIKDTVTSFLMIPLGTLLALLTSKMFMNILNNAVSLSSKIKIQFSIPVSISLFMKLFILILGIFILARILSFLRLRKLVPIDFIINKPKEIKKGRQYHKTVIEKLFGIEAVIGSCYRKQSKRKYLGVLLSCYFTFVLFLLGGMILRSTSQSSSMNQQGIAVSLKTVTNAEEYTKIQTVLQQMQELSSVDTYACSSSLIINDINISFDNMNEEVSLDASSAQDKSVVLQILAYQSSDFLLKGQEIVLDDQYQYEEDGMKITSSYYDVKPEELQFSISGYQEDQMIEKQFSLPVLSEDIAYPTNEKDVVNEDIISLLAYVSNQQMYTIMQELQDFEEYSIQNTATFYGDEEALLEDLKIVQKQYSQYISDITVIKEVENQNQAIMNAYFLVIIMITSMVIAISILNLICIMLSNIISKIKDIMLLSSIGLENKQMITLLFYEHIIILYYALFFASITIVSVYPMVCDIIFTNGEQVSFDIMLLFGVILFICVLSILLLYCSYWYIKKQNISENLRMEA